MRKTTFIALATLAAATAAGAQDIRREDRGIEAAEAREAEVRIAVPRNADGAIDKAALEREIRARFAAGATELQFRGVNQQEAARLLLDAKTSLLADLAALLPNDGVERQVRLRGAIDARVQRNDEGELRARIEGINIGTLTPTQRADLARQLAAQGGLDRLRIRGVDANGERVARAERPERAERVERPDHSGRH